MTPGASTPCCLHLTTALITLNLWGRSRGGEDWGRTVRVRHTDSHGMEDDQFLIDLYLALLEARGASELRDLQEFRQLNVSFAQPSESAHKPRPKGVVTHCDYVRTLRVLASTRARASQPMQFGPSR